MTNLDPNDTPCEGKKDGLPPIARRSILLVGLGLLAGCATTGSKSVRMPGPLWPDAKLFTPTAPVAPAAPLAPARVLAGVIPRSAWTKGTPQLDNIDPMLPVRWITIHHDGMTPFLATDYASCVGRIELIRNGHRGKGWADIGYHFIVDRSGRVWEGRDLRYQGAHVKDQNEGNLGILCMGNFDQQTPSLAQLVALDRHLRLCMVKYKVKASQVRSHQEWASAKTACPGRNLQSKMNGIRRAIA
ncbi:MAG: N-acetylmuramoyl-L-alanine amidase [Phycisphaerales bacterium]|nr:N-acetylmuramoyl-L-alanine amidase [Phycisphaerales bacterium]